MAEQKKTVQLVKKKKKWLNIHLSKDYGGALVGESYVSEANELIGKRLNVDLSIVSKTRNPNVRLVFEVKNISDGNAVSEPIGYYVLSAYLKRLVRKGKTKIDESYIFRTKDDITCVIKVFLITKSKIQSKISGALRVELKKLIESEFKKKDFSQLFEYVILYGFQKSLKESLNKIYPLQALEIRMFYRK